MASRILVAVSLAASPKRAFDSFTAEIGLWWQPNSMFGFTPREGGRMVFEGGEGGRLVEVRANGKVFEVGKISVWSPPHRLVFSWRQASFAPGQTTEVEVRFVPVDQGTRVTVEHRGWDTVPPDHVARHGFPDTLFLVRHGEWWRSLLASLAAFIADRSGG